LLNLLRCDPKNGEYLNNYLNDYIHHLHGRWDFCIDLEASEKHLNALKDVDKGILTCPNILSCLRNERVTMVHTKLLRKIPTERRTPTPANITLAGENTCQVAGEYKSADLKQVYVLRHTRPTPAPRVAERE
jgi:hypothetical protein